MGDKLTAGTNIIESVRGGATHEQYRKYFRRAEAT
jgi:hypothetical protein